MQAPHAQEAPYPQLPAHVTGQLLKRLTAFELVVIIERFGVKQIAARLGVGIEDALRAKGQQS